MICTSSALGLEAMAAKVAATALCSVAATFRGATILGLCRLNDSLRCLPPRRILPVCRISRQAPTRALFCVPLRANSSAAAEVQAEKAKNSEVEDDNDEEEYDEEEEEEFRIRNESSSKDEEELEGDEDDDFESGNESVNDADTDSKSETKMKMPIKSKFPPLSPREKRELLAVVHTLGKEMKIQHIGKWGVTPNTLHCMNGVLDKRELLKVRVLPNCPADVDQVVYDLIDGLEAQLVSKIGHIIVLYRPSVKKAEKEEKRKIDQAKWERRQQLWRRSQQRRA